MVIGGGFAGLAAARTLLQQPMPCHVTVLEAKSRWGGRLHSVCLNDNDNANENVHADLGGMFWHGNTAVYQALASDFPHVESILTDGDSKIPAADSAMWLRHDDDKSASTTTSSHFSGEGWLGALAEHSTPLVSSLQRNKPVF